MEKTRRGWYEREEIQKVTLDWVKTNCKPTLREMELLRIIYDRKLVRRDHLEIISDSYRNLGKNRTRLLNRAINKLYSGMCIDKMQERQEYGKGNTPLIVALDKGGSILLDVPHKRRIAHKKTTIKGREYIYRSLPINYKHINGINKTEVDTLIFCEETDHKLLRWDHEVPKEFFYGGEKIVMIPDVFLELKIKDETLFAYLEYDTGSENRGYKKDFPIINEKLHKYRKFKSSKLWMEEANYFPMILFVTEDHKRIEHFNKKSKELGLKGFGVYHEKYIDFLKHLASMV